MEGNRPELKVEQCDVVEMAGNYPFGELKQAQHAHNPVLVRKKLVYSHPQQLDIIHKMMDFLHSLESEHLVHLLKTTLQPPETFYFYYEYAPLRLQKWILDLGDDIIQQIEFEMLALANYLTQKNVKFSFDPHCLGISKEIRVKYFLNEFVIDDENKMGNYKHVEQQINAFFKDFRTRPPQQQEQEFDFTDRKSADSALLLNRIQMLIAQPKRESWDGKNSLNSVRSRKNLMLSEKIENSKKKQMEIMERLKKLKQSHTG